MVVRPAGRTAVLKLRYAPTRHSRDALWQPKRDCAALAIGSGSGSALSAALVLGTRAWSAFTGDVSPLCSPSLTALTEGAIAAAGCRLLGGGTTA